MTPTPLRLAMWSGPRNISTALMRSWGNRADTFVTDEPFYAHYLRVTGKPHPGADEVMASQENDWSKVAAWLTGPIPEGKAIWYQKQMAHHLLPQMGRDWLRGVTHGFLIRDPGEMLPSLLKNVPEPTLEDTGLPQQVEIFNNVRQQTGVIPPVLDAREVLENPRRMLGLLCDALGVRFEECMLHWPAGPRATDGVWAKHWYHEVEKSSAFHPYRPKSEQVPPRLAELHRACEGFYATLHAHRLGQ